MLKQPLEIEVEILKSRLDSLEENHKWLTSNWVDWTKSTKDVGQRIIIALDQMSNAKS